MRKDVLLICRILTTIHLLTYKNQNLPHWCSQHLIYHFADKATNPANREEDWDFIMSFCDQVNRELEGPQISVRLIAHKIQSPQEREALYALSVSE